MSYSLVNAATTDELPGGPAAGAAYLLCPLSRRLRVHVDNGAVLWQYARTGDPNPQWQAPEATLLPGIYTLEQPVHAVRFRSLTRPTDPARPPRVSVQALTAADL